MIPNCKDLELLLDQTADVLKDWPLDKLLRHVRLAYAEHGFTKTYNKDSCEYEDTVAWSDARWHQEMQAVSRLNVLISKEIEKLVNLQDQLIDPWRFACVQHVHLKDELRNMARKAPAAATAAPTEETGAAKRKGGRPRKTANTSMAFVGAAPKRRTGRSKKEVNE